MEIIDINQYMTSNQKEPKKYSNSKGDEPQRNPSRSFSLSLKSPRLSRLTCPPHGIDENEEENTDNDASTADSSTRGTPFRTQCRISFKKETRHFWTNTGEDRISIFTVA